MARLLLEQPFFDLFPHSRVGVMQVLGIANTETHCAPVLPEIHAFLAEQNEYAKTHLTQPVLSQCPAVAVWREAFSRFKKKKGACSSIEALLRRIEKGKGVGPINPLVDLYNAVSLHHAIPCGVMDADKLLGDLRLTVTRGGDPFRALGNSEEDETLPGEVCYLDDGGCVCRFWNWRDCRRTMLTQDTRNALIVFDCVDSARSGDLSAAMDLLAGWMEKTVGGRLAVRAILCRETPWADLAD